MIRHLSTNLANINLSLIISPSNKIVTYSKLLLHITLNTDYIFCDPSRQFHPLFFVHYGGISNVLTKTEMFCKAQELEQLLGCCLFIRSRLWSLLHNVDGLLLFVCKQELWSVWRKLKNASLIGKVTPEGGYSPGRSFILGEGEWGDLQTTSVTGH